MFLTKCAVLLSLIAAVHCEIEGYIVGGEIAEINQFPYSAYLQVSCTQKPAFWACGSSILNQEILLTAAHCIDECKVTVSVTIHVGNANNLAGHTTRARSYLKHQSYVDSKVQYDIGLVRMYRRVTFSNTVSRIAIMRSPPSDINALVAGWGLIDEKNLITTNQLMRLKQKVWPTNICRHLIEVLAPDVLCASSNDEDKYISAGDSGSALTIRGYIQIGIVSYKLPNIATNLIVYANVSHYYMWIKANVKKLYCSS